MTHALLSQQHIDDFQRDGVVLIRGMFAEHVDVLRAGIERNMEEPGPYAAENLKAHETG
ncbi:MAG: phytanoyl-CoA dioxygenase, partial [Boseongicola sp.]|nr:phytanoyl-CoA dioxygenase [Boseongicola sp.]